MCFLFSSFSSKAIDPIALWRFLCTKEALSFPFVRDDGMEVFMRVISDRRWSGFRLIREECM